MLRPTSTIIPTVGTTLDGATCSARDDQRQTLSPPSASLVLRETQLTEAALQGGAELQTFQTMPSH